MLIINEAPPKHFDEVKIYFSDKENVRKISNNNFEIDNEEINKYLNEFINGRPNIYALLIKKPNDVLWILKYIGQCGESKGIKWRLREHLINSNKKTGDKRKE